MNLLTAETIVANLMNATLSVPDALHLLLESADSAIEHTYPKLSGSKLDDLQVKKDIPNMVSIASSLDDYIQLNGVRLVPLHMFSGIGKSSHYSLSGKRKVEDLMQQIKTNKWISPLIVVTNNEGLSPYVLEGHHRVDALYELGYKHIPAIVVVDHEDDES